MPLRRASSLRWSRWVVGDMPRARDGDDGLFGLAKNLIKLKAFSETSTASYSDPHHLFHLSQRLERAIISPFLEDFSPSFQGNVVTIPMIPVDPQSNVAEQR